MALSLSHSNYWRGGRTGNGHVQHEGNEPSCRAAPRPAVPTRGQHSSHLLLGGCLQEIPKVRWSSLQFLPHNSCFYLTEMWWPRHKIIKNLTMPSIIHKHLMTTSHCYYFQFFHIINFCDVHFLLYEVFSYLGLSSWAVFPKVRFPNQRVYTPLDLFTLYTYCQITFLKNYNNVYHGQPQGDQVFSAIIGTKYHWFL